MASRIFRLFESQPLPGGDFLPVSPERAYAPIASTSFSIRMIAVIAIRLSIAPIADRASPLMKDIPTNRPKTTIAGISRWPAMPRLSMIIAAGPALSRQPTACAVCGPRLIFLAAGIKNESEAALQSAREWIKSGKIIAVKGLGGFHLACDAGNETAVAELRRRKKRSDKAFALMAFNMAAIETYAEVSPAERKALLSNERPIVLVKAKEHTNLAPSIAPGQKRLGFMLAYTPLHLLLPEPEQDFPDVLVMTSANLSEEPIVYRDADVIPRLSLLADGYLTNDRPIHMRVDDSVMQICQEIPQIIRRARGFCAGCVLICQPANPQFSLLGPN
jgi:hydrogenase maturation protein HypF